MRSSSAEAEDLFFLLPVEGLKEGVALHEVHDQFFRFPNTFLLRRNHLSSSFSVSLSFFRGLVLLDLLALLSDLAIEFLNLALDQLHDGLGQFDFRLRMVMLVGVKGLYSVERSILRLPDVSPIFLALRSLSLSLC